MKNIKKLPLVFCLILTVAISPKNSKALSDINSHWANNYITALSNRNVLHGYEDGTFKPDNNMTRAEFYATINKLMGNTKNYKVTFEDVSKGAWYYDDVAKGIKAGFITPTTGRLNPNQNITRKEVVEIIGIIYNLPENESALNFSDSRGLSKTQRGYAGTLVRDGVISGMPDGTFRPDNDITRAEVSKIIMQALLVYGEPKSQPVSEAQIKFGPRSLYN